MKYALVEGIKSEPSPNTVGVCETCGTTTISRCGRKKRWHWAHKSKSNCDPWWENETDWHRGWKDKFPHDWQEVTIINSLGEKHRADIKTKTGIVVEIQHSPISSKDILTRNTFYKKIIWIIDGKSTKKNRVSSRLLIDNSNLLITNPEIRCLVSPGKKIFDDWKQSNSHAFIDFDDTKRLIWILPTKDLEKTYYVVIDEKKLLEILLEDDIRNFDNFIGYYGSKFNSHFSKIRESKKKYHQVNSQLQKISDSMKLKTGKKNNFK